MDENANDEDEEMLDDEEIRRRNAHILKELQDEDL